MPSRVGRREETLGEGGFHFLPTKFDRTRLMQLLSSPVGMELLINLKTLHFQFQCKFTLQKTIPD